MTEKKLQAGIIGLGVGEQHIAGYNSHESCEVAFICDNNPDKLAEVSKRHTHISTTQEALSILNNPNIDIVSIASYDNHHHQQITQALKNNKHVFVEKPLCLFEEEAKEIRDLQKQRPQLKISSNLILRKCPLFIELRQWIQEGRLGEIYAIDADYNYGRVHKITDGWRGKIPYYSVFLGGGVHMVDLLIWLFQDLSSVVSARAEGNQIVTSESDYKFPDYINASLRFDNGAIARVSSNYSCVYPHFHRLSIYGTKATFVHDPMGTKLFESRDPKVTPKSIHTDYPSYHKGDLIRSFIDEIVNQGTSEVNVEDIFKTMSVCFAVESALKSGLPEEISYL